MSPDTCNSVYAELNDHYTLHIFSLLYTNIDYPSYIYYHYFFLVVHKFYLQLTTYNLRQRLTLRQHVIKSKMKKN
jgi:hypothetical protein